MEPYNLTEELSGLSATAAAARLIGSDLIRLIGDRRVSGRIVEVEAYDQTDPASHSYRGVTPRNSVMFGPAGKAYVYFTYGMHYCMNVVTGPVGVGEGVLIRALEPLEGLELMAENRGVNVPARLLSGPAKLAQALTITREHNDHDLGRAPLILSLNPPLGAGAINWSPRIGIKESSVEVKLWRATLSGSPYLSRLT